jgi:hypothetical protein
MDPLSIIASAITIASPILIGLKKWTDTRHAKTDILLLANEVSEIVLLLQELDQALRQQNQQIGTGPNPRLLQTLDAISQELRKLSSQISEWDRTKTQQSVATKSQPVRWITISSKVTLFKDNLRRIRSQLMYILSMINM